MKFYEPKEIRIMRKLKLQVQMTVDGFIAGPNGELDWMVWDWDAELKQYVTDITEDVDTIVLGRKLAEGFIPHWAAQPEGEDAESINKINQAKKVVFTKTLDQAEWDNTILAKGDLTAEITKLKAQDGQNMIAYGGATFVSGLIQHGLIDEYHLFINPAAIGRGMTIFEGVAGIFKLRLVRSRGFVCGITALHYEPV
jgi:dihydrofolate reductase